MTEKYFIPASTIEYGRTPDGVAFKANLYSMETREQVGHVCNDGNGGATYFRPLMNDKAKAGTYSEVEQVALEKHDYSELYYNHLMDLAESVLCDEQAAYFAEHQRTTGVL